MFLNDKNRFLNLLDSACKERTGYDDFREWILNSDFFVSPASTKYHDSEVGGLLHHSIKVYDELCRLCKIYEYDFDIIPHEKVVSALLHDICKIHTYTIEKAWRKDDNNKWEQYDRYKFEEKFPYGSHGGKSVYLIQRYMPLSENEAVAINCHMGAWDGNTNVSSVYEKYPLAWLLHVADEKATFLP